MTAALLMTVRPAADTSSDMEVLSLATPPAPRRTAGGEWSPRPPWHYMYWPPLAE